MARQDPKGNSAAQKQVDRWRKSGVEVVHRPLRYPQGWPQCAAKPEEKGIDVALAIDFVMMAHRNQFDVGIIMSCDTDLRPAIEAVMADTDKRVEVAAWKATAGDGQRLAVPKRDIWCNWLTLDHYNKCADGTDYSAP